MKNFFLAIQCIMPNNQRYARVLTTNPTINVCSQLNPSFHIVSANICESKKQAENIVREWNESFAERGILYDSPWALRKKVAV